MSECCLREVRCGLSCWRWENGGIWSLDLELNDAKNSEVFMCQVNNGMFMKSSKLKRMMFVFWM